LILVAGLLAEFVAIAAADNQWVTTSVRNWLAGSSNGFGLRQGFVISTQVFHWRFSPPSPDPVHSWPASLAMIGATLLVTGLLLFALTRGVASAGRVFWSGLLATVFAAQVGAIVGGLVIKSPGVLAGGNGTTLFGGTFSSRLTEALFGAGGISGVTFIGSAMFGVVVGCAAAFAASRRGRSKERRLKLTGSTLLDPGVSPVPAVWTPPIAGVDPDDTPGGRHHRTN
jgi:hypothetical protein